MKYLFIVSIAVYIFSVFYSNLFIQYMVSILAVACIFFSFFAVKGFPRFLGLIFLFVGGWCLFGAKAGAADYLLSFGEMFHLLSLFALVPLFALPIRYGNYAVHVENIVQQKIKTPFQLYGLTSGLSYILSSFINVATMPMMYYSIRHAVDLFAIQDKIRFMSNAITRGFCMPLLWAPVTPIVGIMIEMIGVDWGALLRITVPLSLLGLALDWLVNWFGLKKEASQRLLKQSASDTEVAAAREQSASAGQRNWRLSHILAAVLIINVLIWAGEKYFDKGFLAIVTILVIPVSLIWCMLLKSGKKYVTGFKEHLDTHIIKMKDQFYIFLCAGFFLSAVQISGFEEQIHAVFVTLKDMIGQHWFIILLPVVPLVLSLSGLHPTVALIIVAQAIDSEVLSINPEILFVAILGGAVPAFLMGPYNATLGIMSATVGVSTYRLSRWNALFTLLYLGMIMASLAVLQQIL